MHRVQEIVGVFDLAGIACRIQCCGRGFSAFLCSRYSEFVSDASPQFTITVKLTEMSPEELWAEGPGPFAQIGGQDGVLTIEGPGFRGTFDEQSREGWIAQPLDPAPLETFLTAICAGCLLRSGGFLLHAAAAVSGDGAFVFFGPSESGKTTVAELIGTDVISDEIVAVRGDGKGYRVLAVPWRGRRLSAPLRGLFRLRKGRETRLTPLSPAGAVRQLLPSVLFPRPDFPEVGVFLEIGGQLATKVPCYEIHFRHDRAFWEVVHGLSL